MGRLEGKVALVTGGNSGIGLAAAQRFVAEGAFVFVTARRKGELEAAVAQLGRNAQGVVSDVSKISDLDRLFAIVRETKGHLDILFANAGVASGAPLGDITEEQYHWMFDINVKGTLFTVQKALPLMRAGASIILNASVVASKGMPGRSVYSATKAALRSFARTWTSDLKSRGIRVNVVSPGTIDTPGSRGLSGLDSAGLGERARSIVPLGRTGTPEEIADAVLFLASDESRYMAGSELFVDGGLAQV